MAGKPSIPRERVRLGVLGSHPPARISPWLGGPQPPPARLFQLLMGQLRDDGLGATLLKGQAEDAVIVEETAGCGDVSADVIDIPHQCLFTIITINHYQPLLVIIQDHVVLSIAKHY